MDKEISYLTSFNTLAGEVKFQNEVNFIKEKFVITCLER